MRERSQLQAVNQTTRNPGSKMNTASALPTSASGFGPSWRVSPVQLVLGLTLLALAVRLVGLNWRPLWLDEAYSAWLSSRGWRELWTVVPTYEPHPPFYYSLLKLWRDLFGGSAVALRGFSVLFGVLTVPAIAAAAAEQERQLPSGRPQLRIAIAALLAACSPMLLMLGQEARPYPLLTFAFATAVLGLLRLFREFKTGPGTWGSWALLAGGTEVVLWSHGLGVLYAFCLAAALAPAWLKNLERSRLLRGTICAAAVAILYLPCLAMMLSRTGDWGTGWLSWRPEMLLQLLGLYAIPWEAMTVGSAVAAIVLLLLVKRAVQIAVLGSGWNSDRAVLLLWWGPPLIAAAVSAIAIPIFLPRTLVGVLVPAYLAYAGAISRTEAQLERFGVTAALAIILPVTAMQVVLRPATEDWPAVAAYLDRNVRLGDQVWLYPNDSALPLREADSNALRQARGIPGDYPATHFKGPIRAGSPAVVSLTPDQANRVARDPTLHDVPVIWVLSRQSGLFDPKSDLPSALSAVRRPGAEQDWGYISVRSYYRR